MFSFFFEDFDELRSIFRAPVIRICLVYALILWKSLEREEDIKVVSHFFEVINAKVGIQEFLELLLTDL
jgi:hypothetical protein